MFRHLTPEPDGAARRNDTPTATSVPASTTVPPPPLGTERASLRQVGVFSNPLLLWGIAFEIAFAAALIYLPPIQAVFGTRPLGLADLAPLAPFPVVVWGMDEIWRAAQRWRGSRTPGEARQRNHARPG